MKGYFIEIKVVAKDLATCRELIDNFIKEGYQSDGIIQNDDIVYWSFLKKDFGLSSVIININFDKFIR